MTCITHDSLFTSHSSLLSLRSPDGLGAAWQGLVTEELVMQSVTIMLVIRGGQLLASSWNILGCDWDVNKTELLYLYSGQVNRNKSIFEWDHKVRFIPNILNYLLSRNIRNWENERLIVRAAILQIQIKLLNLDLRNLNRRFILKIEIYGSTGGRSTLTEENVLVGNRKVLHRIRVFLNNMNISDVVSHVAIEACKKQISFSHCEKEKVNFSRNEIIELERRIALLGRYIIHRIKRGTMRIIIDHTAHTRCYLCSRCPCSCCWRGRRARGSTRRARWSGAGWP